MSQGDKDHRQKLTPTEKKSACMCASLRVDSVCVGACVCTRLVPHRPANPSQPREHIPCASPSAAGYTKINHTRSWLWGAFSKNNSHSISPFPFTGNFQASYVITQAGLRPEACWDWSSGGLAGGRGLWGMGWEQGLWQRLGLRQLLRTRGLRWRLTPGRFPFHQTARLRPCSPANRYTSVHFSLPQRETIIAHS